MCILHTHVHVVLHAVYTHHLDYCIIFPPYIFQSWQFSDNSIHYILGFWKRLIGSVPYIRSVSEPHLLDTYVPEVICVCRT